MIRQVDNISELSPLLKTRQGRGRTGRRRAHEQRRSLRGSARARGR